MASEKRSKKGKARQKQPIAPPSTKEPPAIRSFGAPSEHIAKGITVDDLRRSTADTTWSVNEQLDASGPPPRYPLGASTEGLSIADPNRRIDWSEIFSIPPRNPDLLKRAIELELLPAGSISLLPISPEEETHLNLEHPTE
jgi:hypothetical protein